MTKKISEAQTAKQGVRLRKKYRVLRLVLKILFAILATIDVILLLIYVVDSGLSTGFLYVTFVPMVTAAIYIFASMSLPISGMTMDDMKEEEFALYLRGFSSDDYEQNSKLEKAEQIEENKYKFGRKSIKEESEYLEIETEDAWGIKNKIVIEKPFTEYSFCNSFKKHYKMPMFSIGMTKELESPEGCKRIYLDDETWQNDVGSLIKRAKRVFVLVNPSDSCIWEILECNRIGLDKTVFIIHDPKRIKEMCERSQDTIPELFKDLINQDDDAIKHTVAFVEGGKMKVLRYVNTEKGFAELFNELP